MVSSSCSLPQWIFASRARCSKAKPVGALCKALQNTTRFECSRDRRRTSQDLQGAQWPLPESRCKRVPQRKRRVCSSRRIPAHTAGHVSKIRANHISSVSCSHAGNPRDDHCVVHHSHVTKCRRTIPRAEPLALDECLALVGLAPCLNQSVVSPIACVPSKTLRRADSAWSLMEENVRSEISACALPSKTPRRAEGEGARGELFVPPEVSSIASACSKTPWRAEHAPTQKDAQTEGNLKEHITSRFTFASTRGSSIDNQHTSSSYSVHASRSREYLCVATHNICILNTKRPAEQHSLTISSPSATPSKTPRRAEGEVARGEAGSGPPSSLYHAGLCISGTFACRREGWKIEEYCEACHG